MKKRVIRPPKGYAFATKYRRSNDEVGLFPKAYKDQDVNDLPLETIDHYYWAENIKGKEWEVQAYTKGSGHTRYVPKEVPKKAVQKHLICLASADLLKDQAEQTMPSEMAIDIGIDNLKACHKYFNIKMKKLHHS